MNDALEKKVKGILLNIKQACVSIGKQYSLIASPDTSEMEDVMVAAYKKLKSLIEAQKLAAVAEAEQRFDLALQYNLSESDIIRTRAAYYALKREAWLDEEKEPNETVG